MKEVKTNNSENIINDSGREHISKENLIKIGFHIFRQFDDQYYTGFAAQIAYFFFMGSVPTLVVLSQLLGFFDLSLDIIKKWLETNVSENISSFVMGLFSANSVKATNILLIVLAIWAASSLEFSLSRLTSYTLTDGAYRFDFFRERLKSIPTALFTIFAVAFILVIFVYGEEIFMRFLKEDLFVMVLIKLRLPLAAAAFFAMITLNYYILPRIRVPLKAVLPGAVFASVGILVVTVFYSFYINYVANYNILYGAFASIVALMLWFYIISWVLCIGMMFNKAWDEIMKRDRLTHMRMIEYIEKQSKLKSGELKKRYSILPTDQYNAEFESLAVKLSKKYVKGFEEELRIKQQKEAHKKL